MLLAVALAVMTLVVVATVVLPLMRGARAAPERGQFDRAVYRDQLRELERDRARGLIDAGEAATARLEIERRLLATERRSEPAASGSGGSPVLAVALALLVPTAAVLAYLALGSPGVPDAPYAARGPERALAAATGHADMEKTADALEARVKANPASDADWLLLARTEAALGHWQKSADAYRQAMRLTQNRPDVAASYGEMLVMAADGVVTPRAHDILAAALTRDPGNVAARYYLALADAQAGHAEAAIAAWQKLAAEQPADSPIRRDLEARIAEAAESAGLPAPALAAPAAGPSAEQMEEAAKMTPEARAQMIRGMVAGLAAKLEAAPDDLDGWLRLGRAYGVLGEHDKAADAYEHALRLKPDDPQIMIAEAEVLLPDQKPETPVPERAVSLLRRVDALDPKQPAALWYLGLAAAQQRDFAAASGYWQRLLPLLPPESQQHEAVAAAIEALRGK
ncbi:MAG TPA: c-type cytochrome biogenesis protein CcmI [Stellaceae bacterium]|nr:c-type cytochrome biogenesis protein CcmI [Stellaceae bacterium]